MSFFVIAIGLQRLNDNLEVEAIKRLYVLCVRSNTLPGLYFLPLEVRGQNLKKPDFFLAYYIKIKWSPSNLRTIFVVLKVFWE